MTKTRLIKWLEEQMSVARRNAEEQYDVAVRGHKVQMDALIEINEVAKQVADLTSKAEIVINTWLEKIREIESIETVVGYKSTRWFLNNISTIADIKKAMEKEYVDDSDVLNQLREKKKLVDAGIITNYNNVIENIRCLKDAKAGISYLQELGFDLSKLMKEEVNPTTALSVPVDKNYLFVCEVDDGTRKTA